MKHTLLAVAIGYLIADHQRLRREFTRFARNRADLRDITRNIRPTLFKADTAYETNEGMKFYESLAMEYTI